jgi:hypothetical protein
MNANELRIGNFIYFIICNKEDSKLDELKKMKIDSTDFKYIQNDISLFEPIPLTEKWLSDFCFKKTNESEEVEWYNLDGFEIAIHEEDGKVYFVYQHMVLRHITNVHQLQNLYFALTGKELLIC